MANRGWEEDLRDIGQADALELIRKDKEYGSSWKLRGGCGAYFMLARKIDRIEVQVKKHGYDIFAAIKADPRDEGLKDDLEDLARYIMLVRAEVKSWGAEPMTLPVATIPATLPRGNGGAIFVHRGRPAVDHPAPYGYDREESE